MSHINVSDHEYDEVPRLILESAPEFANSEEYLALDARDLVLPAVVCGAFNRYFCRLQNAVTRERKTHSVDLTRVTNAYRVIDRLSASMDPEVVNLVVVEIFEYLDFDSETLALFEAQLGEKARKLFKRWVKQ